MERPRHHLTAQIWKAVAAEARQLQLAVAWMDAAAAAGWVPGPLVALILLAGAGEEANHLGQSCRANAAGTEGHAWSVTQFYPTPGNTRY